MSLNPDCRQGKHAACRGDAWDDTTDAPVTCACGCHERTRTIEMRMPDVRTRPAHPLAAEVEQLARARRLGKRVQAVYDPTERTP